MRKHAPTSPRTSASVTGTRLNGTLVQTGVTKDFEVDVRLLLHFRHEIAVADHIAVVHNGRLLDARRAAGLTVDRLRNYYLEVTGDFQPVCWSEEVPA